MLPSARHSPSSDSSKMPPPNLSGLSNWIPLSSTHIIFTRDLASKLETLQKAVQLFEKAHRSRPEDYQATALRALALHELGRADEAREADQEAVHLINKYLEVNPN